MYIYKYLIQALKLYIAISNLVTIAFMICTYNVLTLEKNLQNFISSFKDEYFMALKEQSSK